MTETEIVTVLAEREGYTNLYFNAAGECFGIPPGEAEPPRVRVPDYLNSRDALAGVLEKLTEEERWSLFHELHKVMISEGRSFLVSKFTHWLLTLPPRQLAGAVAKVIKDVK
jgi:hypothetical protein